MNATAALLVPCYNAEAYLPRLREQVDRLKPAFDEVILADDGSHDGTAERAETLGFRILRLPRNLGPGGARNALAHAATATWLHFHDVDDEIAPDYLSQVGPAVRPDTDAVLHFTDFIDEQSRSLLVRWQFEAAALAGDPAHTLLTRPLPTMSSFVRRAVFLQLGGFDVERRCFEDGDFHFRLAASGARLATVPAVLEWSLRHERGAGANQHYCAKCRLHFLRHYAVTQPPRLRSAIAEEAEKIAVQLVQHGDKASARAAITLCHSLGRRVPTTHNPLARALRAIFPPLTLLHWQHKWRQLH